MFHIKVIRCSGWKFLALILLFFQTILITFYLESFLNSSVNPKIFTDLSVNKESGYFAKKTSFQNLITIVFLEFDFFENNLSLTVENLCLEFENLDIIIITEKLPYPPILFKHQNNCNIRIISTQIDPKKNLFETKPEYFLHNEFVLIVPDSVVISSKLLSYSLQINNIKNKEILAISIIDVNEKIENSYSCYKIDYNIKEWTLKFDSLKHEHRFCDAIDGLFAYLIKTEDLKHFNAPFVRPFPLSLFLQAKIKNFKISIENDIKFYKLQFNTENNQYNEIKRKNLEFESTKLLFKNFGIKKFIKDNKIFWFGCNKQTPRCFPTIYQDTPNYLLEGKWTPPCCLENLKIITYHVLDVLEGCKVRYWLEGGSLLGAVRNSSIILWDYDVDIGIYKDDIKNCAILKIASTNPVRDEKNFLWEPAVDGQYIRINLSPINKLHVDIFPFFSKKGIMTKKTWFKNHPQDKEFPESFLQPIEKMLFLNRSVSIPNNARQFLEFKFGKGVIENAKYPNDKLLNHSPYD